MTAFWTILGVLSLWNVEPSNEPPVANSRLRSPQALLGYCAGAQGSLDMAKLLIVENRSISLSRSTATAEINQESIIYRYLPENNLAVFDINALISPDEDLDILARFAVYNGNLVIYWRETYLNRSYRQGVLLLGERPQVLCEGRGGADTSH